MTSENFRDKSFLITGGTGSFGQSFLRFLLQTSAKRIVIFSRDEMKQWEMAKHFKDDRIRFFIGDVRDRDRLSRAMQGINYVIHAAATKIVPTAEYNPFECVKTNIIGAMNLIDVAIDRDVERVVALSTDKASSPINLYGATKLTSDKLFVSGNAYSGEHGTKFSVVRYGNVMGSRGSVIPLFIEELRNGKNTLPITDFRMTRFMITLDQGIQLVLTALSDMHGGEIYVKKIPSMKVIDIANSVAEGLKLEETGIRPGEKLHEQMIGIEDAGFTYEFSEYYKILPQINDWHLDSGRINGGRLVDCNFCYSSDTNKDWMDVETLRKWIRRNQSNFISVN